MSRSTAKEDRKKRRTLLLRPAQGVSSNSVAGSTSRRSFSLGGGSKVLVKSAAQTPWQDVRVFDDDDNDVTPLPLYEADPGAVQVKASRFYVEEISAESASDQTTATGSFSMPFSRSVLGSSRISSQSTIESMNEEIEDTFSKRDIPINFPDVPGRRDTLKQQLTKEILKEVIDIYISETDSISLLDIPSTMVSVDADDAEVIIAKNNQYAEVCRYRMGNDKYMDRSVQTLNGAVKNKHVQTESMTMVDTATNVTSWDMYDRVSYPEQDDTVHRPELEQTDYPEAVLESSRGAERSMSVGSTASTASAASSLKDLEVFGSILNAESDLQLIMHSVKFQQCLMVMERSILLNTLQPKMAAYRRLPVLEDSDSAVQPTTLEQRSEETESCRSPTLGRLWAFTCKLSRGRSVSSMAWNKRNPWPERVFLCDSAVTSLDFSANCPGQLAVGLHDGTIAIYNVQSQDNRSTVISSRVCPNRHLGPVWQLTWTQQDLNLTGEKAEALFSVSADGRISKWFIFNNGLDCTDVMKLKRIHNTKNINGQRTDSVLSALTPGLCVDFHPSDSSLYLVGTEDGLIHKCSRSNSQQFLETFRKHFARVNHIAWSPFSPNVFLSCSSDGSIQLWKQDHLNPVLGFTSTQRAVYDVKWSPKWATVFGAINEEQLEIWDLNTSILDPVAMQSASPGVKITSLLFATQADCVLVGDSDGQVTVYQLENIGVGDSGQVEVLEDLVLSAASR